LRKLLRRVEISETKLRLTFRLAAVAQWLSGGTETTVATEFCEDPSETFDVDVPYQIRRCGYGRRLLVSDRSRSKPSPDARLISAITEAHSWMAKLQSDEGVGLKALADQLHADRADLGRRLRLTFLAPDIVERILGGRQPAELTVTRLLRLRDLPLSWAEQRRLLGFPDPRNAEQSAS
jgi:site-specific DNA recombinase